MRKSTKRKLNGLVVCFCIKNCPQNYQFKTTNFLLFKFPWIRNPSYLAERLWSCGTEGFVSSLAVVRISPSVLGAMALYISQLTTRQLAANKWENKKEYPRWKPQSSCNLISEVICYCFYHILFTRESLNPVHIFREGCSRPRVGMPEGRVHRRPSQSLPIPIIKGNLYCQY